MSDETLIKGIAAMTVSEREMTRQELIDENNRLRAENARVTANWLSEQKQRLENTSLLQMYSAMKSKLRIQELESENVKLRDDAARWNYIRRECSQIGSARMDSQHYWRFRQPFGLVGPTIDEAMDNAMRERPILSAAAKENQ